MDLLGGSYREIHALSHESPYGRLHCHHLIPKAALQAVGLDSDLGPVIQVVVRDHPRTGTWGRSREAKAEQTRITDMLRQGDYDAALEAGIADVRSKFGDRYDRAIAGARGYFSTWRPEAEAPTSGARAEGAPLGDSQTNVSLLVNRLTRYLEVLDHHTLAIQHAHDQARESLANLQRVWGGEAAQEFYTRFGDTTEALQHYVDGARRIREILEERLTFLREADRPS